jgi:hypothetical protein
MTISDREREIAWKKTGKGRGNRWLMLRDIVAFLSCQWMNLTILQDVLMRHKGLSRSKVIEMLDQLQRSGDVTPVTGDLEGITVMGYAASDQGVTFWLGSRKNIPASIVREAGRSRPVLKSGER